MFSRIHSKLKRAKTPRPSAIAFKSITELFHLRLKINHNSFTCFFSFLTSFALVFCKPIRSLPVCTCLLLTFSCFFGFSTRESSTERPNRKLSPGCPAVQTSGRSHVNRPNCCVYFHRPGRLFTSGRLTSPAAFASSAFAVRFSKG